jgi:hypothetical protein
LRLPSMRINWDKFYRCTNKKNRKWQACWIDGTRIDAIGVTKDDGRPRCGKLFLPIVVGGMMELQDQNVVTTEQISTACCCSGIWGCSCHDQESRNSDVSNDLIKLYISNTYN